MISRSVVLLLAQCAFLLCPLRAQMTIRLVGTGGPELTPERAGIATLIQTPAVSLLFDAGRGVLDGLYKSRVRPQDVTRVFLTHLHNDHIEGLPTLWITPWFLLGRQTKLEIWGPPGTSAMIEGMRRMYAHDLKNRPNPVLKREYLDITVHEIALRSSPAIAYDVSGVKVTAFPVEHADGDPALGYRVDGSGRSVVLTGDTTYRDNIAALAKGVDVIISNVVAGTSEIEKSGAIDAIMAKLMRPEQAAALFHAAEPRMAVFSHVVKKHLPGSQGDQVILNRVRSAGYNGPLVMGLDRMTILVGASIEVLEPSDLATLPDFDWPDATF
ncbi:MAG: fold metallo-hydrolase [Bryobacterales bacterium]|nr:fold metallo-hydrolase [Bryobacterales bacterium]